MPQSESELGSRATRSIGGSRISRSLARRRRKTRLIMGEHSSEPSLHFAGGIGVQMLESILESGDRIVVSSRDDLSQLRIELKPCVSNVRTSRVDDFSNLGGFVSEVGAGLCEAVEFTLDPLPAVVAQI